MAANRRRQPAAPTSFFGNLTAGYAEGAPLPPPAGRLILLAIFFAILIGGIIVRLFILQIVSAEQYTAEAVDSRTVTVETTPRRGTIYDRNGVILACSVDATTIYCNPREVTDARGEAAIIAAIIGGTAADYQDILATEDTSFAYVKRQADVDAAEALEAYDLDGIYFIDDTRREYPCGEVAGQVVGFCNLDGEGIAGLELYYDDILSGTSGESEAQYGLSGTPIPGEESTTESSTDGTDIMVSIDVDMQAYAEQKLKDYAEIWGVDTDVIMMDAGTGEIYAAASLPLFNPSDPSESEDGSTQVKPITYAIEPGSIFKTVSAMSLLTHDVMRPEDEIECPSAITADGYTVTDAHARGDVTYTLREIIEYSSNVGISLSVEKMGFEPFYNDIINWNLNEATGVDYPGEPDGYLLNYANWSAIQSYNITFGQGVSVTPLQMVRFYGALVNKGVEVTPHFLIAYPETQEQVSYPTEQVIDDQDAIEDMTSMLETVVESGTAKAAQIDGYNVAGKTGTAEVASDEGGYKKGVYNISFTGFLANSSSKLVCYTGSLELPADGTTTAMYKDIMTYAIERYKIAAEG